MKGIRLVIFTIIVMIIIFGLLASGCAQTDLNMYGEVRCFNTVSFWVGSLSASILTPIFFSYIFRNFDGGIDDDFV